VVTLLVGSTLAVVQTDVKRMLAYSSISHAGFILVGVQAASAKGTASCLFYLAAYTFMVIGSFGVVTLVGRTGDARHSLDDYRGLGARRPVLAFAFTLLLLAQAGVPFTTGFFAKFYVIQAAAEAHSYWLAIVAMVAAVIAAYLYLRIVLAMYAGDAEADDTSPVEIPSLAGVAIIITVGVTLVFGFLPSILEHWARDAVPVIVAASTG
jgi:NADH-quinone oxidoreductase subunit N